MFARLRQVWNHLTRRDDTPAGAGAVGEIAAADFLRRRHGFTIIARNWRSPRDHRDELDIIARDGDVLVFVEVKARSVQARVPGYYGVDARKKRALRRAVHAYLTALAHPPRTFRFDIVEVGLAPHLPPQCLHFANVPLFPRGYHVARQTGSFENPSQS